MVHSAVDDALGEPAHTTSAWHCSGGMYVPSCTISAESRREDWHCPSDACGSAGAPGQVL